MPPRHQCHHVPTVFVRGQADTSEVHAVEADFTAALDGLDVAGAAELSYAALWIDAGEPGVFAVEIVVVVGPDTVNQRAVAPRLASAGDACIGDVVAAVQRLRATRV
jgi:hypothetical protein